MFFRKFILFLFFIVFTKVEAQVHKAYGDTLFVEEYNNEHLSKYAKYWADSTKNGNLNNALSALKNKEFKHWELHKKLNLGKNSNPLWYYLKVNNVSDITQKYWWSIYTHADNVFFYQNIDNNWIAADSVFYKTPLKERNIKVRFPVHELDLEKGETRELLMRVVNTKHTQNAIVDFTSAKYNLLWEFGFFWTTAFIVGCFFIIGIISFSVGIILKQRIFLVYGLYLFLVIALSLIEELMVPHIDFKWLSFILYRFHSLPLAVITLSIHYFIVVYILKQDSFTYKKLQIPNLIAKISLFLGSVLLLLYFIFEASFSHHLFTYQLFWYTNIGLIIINLLCVAYSILFLFYEKKQLLIGLLVTAVVTYFNPAGYFLNYSGIFSYYEITYPNYFYWIVCTEFIVLGLLLGWRYKSTEKKNFLLLKEKTQHEEKALQRELQIQENERKKISRDLHDDLGTTLSAIKLIITNSYSNDKALVNMINKANKDLRHFFTKLTTLNINNENIFYALNDKIKELNKIDKTINIEFIGIGNQELLSEDVRQTIYRISVELLSNVLKHAKATEATLQIIVDASQTQIIVEDNGVGFDTKTIKKGMGIDNINTRTKRWKGEVHISSGENGTTTIINIPNTAYYE